MIRPRIIPSLLTRRGGLVKTKKFKEPTYVGDPINAVRIFNDKEVDELVFLDITATVEQKRPPIKLIAEIASECFMPVAYGGGIRNIDDVKEIVNLGIEKVVINSYAIENPQFISQAAEVVGSSSVVVSIDFKKSLFGKYEVYSHSGKVSAKTDVLTHALHMERMGAGELFLNSIDRDGMMSGYDVEIIKRVCEAVHIPVIVCGGAGTINHFSEAIKAGASAVAAGSMFVFQGPHRAVLISFPAQQELSVLWENKS